MTKSTRVSRHGSAGIKFKYPALYFAGTCGVGALQPTLEPQSYVSGVVVTDVAAARAIRSGTVDTGWSSCRRSFRSRGRRSRCSPNRRNIRCGNWSRLNQSRDAAVTKTIVIEVAIG